MVNPLTVTHEQRLLIAELIGDRTHSDLSIEQGRFRLANSIANIMLAKLVTYMGVYGMLAPLYQGGDLEIVTVSRPSGYATKWLLVQLAWQQGQLVKEITKPWPSKGTTGIRGFSLKVKEGRRASIDPMGTRWQHLEQGANNVG